MASLKKAASYRGNGNKLTAFSFLIVTETVMLTLFSTDIFSLPYSVAIREMCMSELLYRRARLADIPAMAEIRVADWGTEEYWRMRILHYLTHEQNPREALRPRISYVCADGEKAVGFIAGHLSRRLRCEGELQWVSIRREYRSRGIALELFRHLAKWFVKHHVLRVCVDVEPSNEVARRFYKRHGANDLKLHWMIWNDIQRVVELPVKAGP